MLPFIGQPGVDANLKEYFNLGIKDTIKSWSMMETIVAIAGIIGVMILNTIISVA
jgi:Gnt-I system high-affinity gluconate transporter